MAAISAKTDQPEVAKKFIEFLLQPETQQQLVDAGDEGYFEPSVAGVNEKEDREKDGKLVYAEASWACLLYTSGKRNESRMYLGGRSR